MKKRASPIAFLTLVIALCAGGASVTRASDVDMSAREARDRAEIQALMWRYVRALDSFDAEGYAATYTPDGQFGTGERAEKGRDALRQMVAGLKTSRAEREAKGEKPAPMYHVITNSNVEFVDKDHARYYAYWMTMFGPAGKDTPPRVAAVGRSVDELVRLDGKWLIKFRDVAPKD
jgi:uncharacterized protein (TIGR02246 family)